MKIVIIGGVAGGASAATRARRLDESAEIILLEKGADPSFANCGMPYYIGGEIEDRAKLLVTPVARLRERYRLDVRPRNEALQIDLEKKQVLVRDIAEKKEYWESFDKLIISTGASPLRPPIPGIDSPKIFTLRDLNDCDRIYEAASGYVQRAVVVGGGFIGVEMAENLSRRGIKVTIVELNQQILPPWDAEMIPPIENHLKEHGIELVLGASADSFTLQEDEVVVQVAGREIKADFVILCVGVRPDSKLAEKAGLAIGRRGGIQVNEYMQSTHPDVYAVGDVVETSCPISGNKAQVPLAGPANRQGRIAADHIFGKANKYRGTQGTAVVGLFGMTAAMTGLSEKQLQKTQIVYEKIYIHPQNHAGYYPGAEQMTLKLIFEVETGRILGAQGVGRSGVEKRIDVIATAIQGGLTVEDLEEAELCYAPQFGSAKDPVNMLGFVAANVKREEHPICHFYDIDRLVQDGWELVDVRAPNEFARGTIPGAKNISVDELRDRIDEIDKNKPVVVFCQVGQRGYLATRILMQNGYRVRNVSGGYRLWSSWQSKIASARPVIV